MRDIGADKQISDMNVTISCCIVSCSFSISTIVFFEVRPVVLKAEGLSV